MPTVTKGEVYPHIGAVWKRIVELWTAWVQDATKTWAFNASSSYLGRPAVLVTLTAGADVEEFYLVDYGAGNSGTYAPDFMLSQPGFQTVPPVLPPTVAGRTTATEWGGKLVAARKQLWINRTSAFSGAYQDFGGYSLPGLTGVVRMQFLGWRYECRLGTDYTTLTTAVETANDTIPGGASLTPEIRINSVTTLGGGGGGGAVDVGPLVTAINDLARRDVVSVIDNGNISVWQFAGDIVEPP